MKKIIKSFVFAAVISAAMFINSSLVEAATYDDLTLKCLYKGAAERVYIELNLDTYSKDLTLPTGKATNLNTGEVFDYTTPMGDTYKLKNGCPDTIKKFKFSKSGEIEYSSNAITNLKSATDATDSSTLLEELDFLTMQSGSKDIFFWASITSFGLDDDKISDFNVGQHVCKYQTAEFPNLAIIMGMDGSYSVVGNDSRSYKFEDNSQLVFYDSMTNDLRCPATVCYNKQSAGKDKIKLSKNASYECSDGIDSHTNTNRQELSTTEIAYDSPERLAEAEEIVGNVDTSTVALGDCYLTLDATQKCKNEGLAYQGAAYYINAARVKVYEPYSAYADEYQAFERCITTNYSQTEITNACAPQIAAEESAFDAAESSENPYVNSLLGYDNAGGSSYSLSTMTCEEVFGDTLIEMFNTFFNIIKIGAILIVIIFSMLDFTKAIMSSDADALKKAIGKLKNRIIVIIILFLLPSIIQYILETFEISSNTNPLCK